MKARGLYLGSPHNKKRYCKPVIRQAECLCAYLLFSVHEAVATSSGFCHSNLLGLVVKFMYCCSICAESKNL